MSLSSDEIHKITGGAWEVDTKETPLLAKRKAGICAECGEEAERLNFLDECQECETEWNLRFENQGLE